MADGFDFQEWGELFRQFEQCSKLAPATEQTIAELAAFRRRLSAMESRFLADMKEAGNSDRNNESVIRANAASKAEARRAAKRAAAVAANRDLGDALADGLIGESQLDAIASAAAQTDGAGARSEELLGRVASAGPDKAAAEARKWVDEQKTQDEHDSRYNKQRRLRKVSRFTTNRGTAAILVEGDDEFIEEAWELLTAKANELYKADGGRDVPAAKHPRSYNQRLFDAVEDLLTGNANGGASPRAPATVHVVTYAKDWTPDGPTKGYWLDGRQVPSTLLKRLMCDAEFVGTVFSGNGEVLFHGRKKRLATPAQFRALIARDRGCVLCGAAPSRCQAHHLALFNSPKAGQTNIDGMALMCGDCHHQLHENRQTLYWATMAHNDELVRVWKTRPATPDENAPKRMAS